MTAVLDVRPARAADAPACAAILQGWLDATPWMPDLHTPAETEAFVAERLMSGTVLVAELDGAVAGFLALCEARDGVVALYVRADARGRGIGSTLLGAAMARVGRLTLWTFRANAPARRFYARHGFVEGRTSAGDNEEGLPDVELTWERAR